MNSSISHSTYRKIPEQGELFKRPSESHFFKKHASTQAKKYKIFYEIFAQIANPKIMMALALIVGLVRAIFSGTKLRVKLKKKPLIAYFRPSLVAFRPSLVAHKNLRFQWMVLE